MLNGRRLPCVRRLACGRAMRSHWNVLLLVRGKTAEDDRLLSSTSTSFITVCTYPGSYILLCGTLIPTQPSACTQRGCVDTYILEKGGGSAGRSGCCQG